MRKFLFSLLFFCGCLSLYGQTYQLEFTEAELIKNNHVGNEWARGVWLGEERMERSTTYRLSEGASYELSVAAQELQEKHNDRGDESVVLTPTLLAEAVLNGGFYIDVTVTERNGRYAGNKAVWRFYFSLK